MFPWLASSPVKSTSEKNVINKEKESPYKAKKELAWEEKKRRREIYNNELFGTKNDNNNNPFYDNSYKTNYNQTENRFFGENNPENKKPEEKIEKKDEFIQTDQEFYKANKIVLNETPIKNNKESGFFKNVKVGEGKDHEILGKIKEDYQDYVRNKMIDEYEQKRKNKNKIEYTDNRNNRYKELTNYEQRTIYHSLNNRDNKSKLDYAKELDFLVKQKSEQKRVEKERNEMLDIKLLKENLEKSPFGRPGAGAPNKDINGNLLLTKGMYIKNSNTIQNANGYSSFYNYKTEDDKKNTFYNKSKIQNQEEQNKYYSKEKNEIDYEPNINNMQNQGFLPKVMDFQKIENEYLRKSEYGRKFGPGQNNKETVQDLKKMNNYYLQEYNDQLKMQKLQEQLEYQKNFINQIEEQKRQKEELARLELEKQKQEEELLRKQREEIIERYKREIEQKQLEINSIQKDQNILKETNEEKNGSNYISDRIQEFQYLEEERNERKKKMHEQLKRKEEEKLYELQTQKEIYEEKIQDINSHLSQVKNELFSQQNMLAQELNILKADALNANEQRFRSQKELENLREELKKQEIQEEIRRIELNKALLKNSPLPRPNYNNLEYPKMTRNYSELIKKYDQNNDALVQRTNWVPLSQLGKNTIGLKNEKINEDLSGNNFFSPKKLFVDNIKTNFDYNYGNYNLDAANILKVNDDRLYELGKIEDSEGMDVKNRLDNLIYEMNKY